MLITLLVLDNQYQISYDPDYHRLRCNGHIINLTAQSFLFQTENEALSNENNTSTFAPPTATEMEQWRQKGPLGKLHNIVVYIQRSPQRIAQFQELSGGRNLSRDNSTRWNSWYKMINTAIQLKNAVGLFCMQHQNDQLDLLSSDEWQDLEKLQSFLLFFYDATLSTESRGATVDRVLPTMDFLLEQFEEGKNQYKDDIFMGPCCNSGWAKLEKYYSLTERSPVYIAALVLCPQNKWDYIDSNWPAEWVLTAKIQMQEFWQTEYKSTAITIPVPEAMAPPQNTFRQWQKKRERSVLDIDEYVKYLQAPVLPTVSDARAWWLEPTQQKTYPALSIMALDMLSIPAMSAEPERLFSSAKITITDRRNKLGIKSIQAIECCKSWLCDSSIPYIDEN